MYTSWFLLVNFSFGNDLIATTLPVRTLSPKLTFPKAPFPKILPYL